MKIVFDTNVFVKNWFLRGPAFNLFEKYLVLSNDHLVIPEIVTLEVKNKYRELFNQQTDKFMGASNAVKGMIPPSIDFSEQQIDLDHVCGEYSQLLDRRLKELNATIVGHSNIPHSRIVERDLARRKPFRKTGKGYRDTLLWEAVLDKVVDKSEKTLLITSDITDFGHRDEPELNPHLVDDLRSKGLAEDSVQIVERIEDFNEKYAKQKLHSLDEIKSKLETGEYSPLSIIAWLEDTEEDIRDKLEQIDASLLISGSGIDQIDISEPITVEYIEIPSSYEIGDVFELDTNRILVEVSLITRIEVEFFIYKSDYIVLGENSLIEIMEWDWNDHVAWASASLRVPMYFSLTFNKKDQIVEDFEVGITEYFGRCRYCDEPILSDAAEFCPGCGKNLF